MTGIEVTGGTVDRADEILTADALDFVVRLQRQFGPVRDHLLAARRARRSQIAKSGRLDFLQETEAIRGGDWTVAGVAPGLVDRRVEMTGPTERKMTINALNSGAKVWLADLEDANTPHWSNVVSGQVNLYDAIRESIEYTSPDGKRYAIDAGAALPTIVMRPRGWHLDERHIVVDGKPAVGALVDFGLYLFHNARELVDRGRGPYFYLPKLESHLEARLWNDVFTFAESARGLRHGTIRATVLIETITAAFEMDEILYELRDHAAGLNAGRWDYLFSIIKNFRDAGPDFVLPDRAAVTMTAPMMRAYTELLVKTCHRRNAFAMGGMAAFIPSRRDPEVNERAFAKVRDDKEREARDGFDGSWVAHPDLVPVCQEIFDRVLGSEPNQISRQRPDVDVAAGDLLDVAATGGRVTANGVRENIVVALQYLTAWLGGLGAVGINNLMEDAATAEISRSQLWQWTHNATKLDSGETITADWVRTVVDEEYMRLAQGLGSAGDRSRLEQARSLFEQVALDDDFVDFLTLPAYALID
jgi:malate synthase